MFDQNKKIVWGIAAAGLLAAIALLIPRGYGLLSEQGYQISLATYSACNRKDTDTLNELVELIQAGQTTGELSKQESGWLIDIIETARSGDWDAAMQEARQLLDDQVTS